MNPKSGFTLVEILIILGILAILFTITSLNLSSTIPKNALDGAVSALVSDLKQQQLYALTGASIGQNSSSDYGIYFSGSKYTIFHGSTFNANDSSNFEVAFDDLNFSYNGLGSVIVFSKNNGEIKNFQPDANTIQISSTSVDKTKSIIINKYGVIESIL